MPHVRIFRHYIHTPFMLFSLVEGLLIVLAAYLGFYTRFQSFPPFWNYFPAAVVFALVLVPTMIAMGVYEARIREGLTGMSLRTAVSFFLLGTAGMAILSYVFPPIAIGRGVLLFATVEAFALILLFRLIAFSALGKEAFIKHVVIIGIGQRALKIASRMRRRADQRAFHMHGFIDPDGTGANDLVSAYGAHVIKTELPLLEYCRDHEIDEIVVAMDERRRNRPEGGGMPLEELMDCRLSGIDVCDVQHFIEREGGRVDVDLLRPSWLVFSDGFIMGRWRAFTKRSFDLAACLVLLLLAWPLMLLAALLVKLSAPAAPVLYRQTRTGFNGEEFDVLKFRTMQPGAEDNGAVWAEQNDPRVTSIGYYLRRARIDELPQLINVLRGEMSFVGPRPERPVFVEELSRKIPFYDERHRVKPGITGWAQLCYPYGASVEDAKEKLQYDLYYLKNHSILLDMIIMLRTVEVVLINEGAR